MVATKEPELSDVSIAFTLIPPTSESEKISISIWSNASGFRFMSRSIIWIITESSERKISFVNFIVPRFQDTGTDSVKTTPSANSKDIVTAESRSTSKNPLVGPFPIVLGFVSKSPLPLASCRNPVRIISPVNIPLFTSVSVNRYCSKEYSRVDILIGFCSSFPIESMRSLSVFQLGAIILISILSVQE